MKKAPTTHSAKITFATLLLVAGLGLLCAIPLIRTSRAQSPTNGSISPTTVIPVTWMGTTTSPGGNTAENTCMDGSAVLGCETYTLTVTGNVSDWAGKKIQVLLTWTSISNEYDIYIHKGSNNGPLVTSAIQGPGLTSQVAFIDPASAGVGTYTVHVAYDTTPTSAVDKYTGHLSVQSSASGGSGVPLALQDPNIPANGIGYENFEAPGVLTMGSSTSSGAVTVEYLGRNAGEPSVGANFNTGVINFESDLETLFVTFDDSCNLSNPKATWVNRRAPIQQFIDSDPIAFTDRETGRVFAGSLTLLSPDTPKVSYTDDDGVTWLPAPFMQGLFSAVDHQSIGGGHYHAPIPSNLPVYPNAVYYCSQDIAASFCARSDGGGAGVGAETPIYNLTQCGGLHGHVKVAPDGTAYVPNRACGSNVGVAVSTDNGTTWTVQQVQNATVTTTPATDDPAIGIDAANKVYLLFSYNGTTPVVAMSTDQGATWPQMFDLGTALGIKNVAFPAAVGGDNGRAAVAFYGSTTDAGDSSADTFPGLWHLYVSHTFDGGAHWTTTDVTPTMPMQRMGLLRGGGGPVDRNLLDFFDITMDRDGRVVVGYVNGCSGGPCSQAASSATGNAYTTTASIARQSSGKRLSGNLGSSTAVPGMPFVTAKRSGPTVTLAWNESDSGNSTITNYDIYRGTISGGETHLAAVCLGTGPCNVTTFNDTTAVDATKTYYYRVVATNAIGSSCANNEVAVPYNGDTCSGLVIHRNLPSHPEATGNGATAVPIGPTPTPIPTPPPATPQLLIDYIAVGEPPAAQIPPPGPSSPNELMFKMKVINLSTVPPNSRWRMVWDWVGTAANPNVNEQYFVGMTSDANSNVTFEYGTVATTSLVVVGVPTENPLGAADAPSNFNADGTITIYVPKSAVGNPQVGDLLGAMNGRTFATGDTAGNTLERSTLLVDHTFIKGNTDNSYPAATYALVGNGTCASAGLVPVGAVSRKNHTGVGDFDIDLPLLGTPGIECRTGPVAGQHTVVLTFSVPVNVASATATCGGQPATATANNTVVTINCSGLPNAQTIAVNLNGVSDGTNTANVSVPMSLLLGDVNGNGTVSNSDVASVKAVVSSNVDLTNFRNDVNANGVLSNGDVSITKAQVPNQLPPQAPSTSRTQKNVKLSQPVKAHLGTPPKPASPQ